MIRRIEIRSPAGLVLGTAPGIRLNTGRFYPVFEKIVRGLYCHHTGRVLPPDVPFNWAINEGLVGGREGLFRAAAAGTTFPGVFECRYGIAAEGTTEMTIWWLRFYEGPVFRCVTQQG